MNKLTDARKNRRFNFADVIIVAVLLLIVMLLAKLFIGDISEYIPRTDKLEYTVKVEKSRADIASLLEVGQTVFDNDTGNSIGVISSLEFTNSEYSEYDVNGDKYLNYKYSDLYDVRINIVTDYKNTDFGYYVNNTKITAGKQLSFRTSTFCADGVVGKTKIIKAVSDNIATIKGKADNGEVTYDEN